MSNQHSIREQAKQTALEFISDLKMGIFTNPAELVALSFVETYYSSRDAEEVIDHLVTHILPYKEHIKNRNVQFFVNKKDMIFKGLPQENVDRFEKLITNSPVEGGLDDENKSIIWQYFDTFIWLSEEYKKKC